MKARRKQVNQVDLDNLDFKKPSSSMEILELQPALEKRQCHILKGQPEEAVQKLVKLIREEGKVF
jgi:electron transfer flavoprotein alpha/beta subunit